MRWRIFSYWNWQLFRSSLLSLELKSHVSVGFSQISNCSWHLNWIEFLISYVFRAKKEGSFRSCTRFFFVFLFFHTIILLNKNSFNFTHIITQLSKLSFLCFICHFMTKKKASDFLFFRFIRHISSIYVCATSSCLIFIVKDWRL